MLYICGVIKSLKLNQNKMKKNEPLLTVEKVYWSEKFYYTSWSLFVHGKQFLLGQDCKWTNRVLGWDINDFFEELGCDDRTEEGRKKIAKWIVKTFKMTPKNVEKCYGWELCCQ
jgi:hypothetical protein